MKTLAYYTALCVFPAHLGIYHEWGYHYDDAIEKEDNLFWVGLLLFISLIVWFFTGPMPIKIGILWYLSYIFIFLNWITIHQFVSERYCYIANIGLCIIIAYYLQNIPVIAALVVGLYLMRTWLHLPAYCDTVRFYESNIWNFPRSEVAMANLGVILIKAGMVGMAMDYWLAATRVNPEYDVPWYNLHSTLKSKGDFKSARTYLVKAVSAKTCHFKDMWSKELEKLDRELLQNRDKIHPSVFPSELTSKIIDTAGNIVEVKIE